MSGRRRPAAPAGRRRPRCAPASRRLRLLLVVSALFAVAVVVTGLPLSSLLAQHQQLAAVSGELAHLQSADRSLASQSRRLQSPGTVSNLGRTDYDLVPPGRKAYVILPPPGASPSEVVGSGHVPLEGPPVVPGSVESQELLGVGPAGPSAGGSSAAFGPASARREVPAGAGSGGGSASFWSRVWRSLEFWR